MNWITWISGPLIGAVIGYFTNYLAVKMLFRPLEPKYLFGHKLPFTPGIIPKRKEMLGGVIGDAVSNNLLTKEDMEQWFLSEDMESAVVDGIVDGVLTEFIREEKLQTVLPVVIGEEKYQEKRAFVSDYVSEKVLSSVKKVDFGAIIAAEGLAMARRKGGMIALFVNEELMNDLGGMVGGQVDRYIEEKGKDQIQPLVDSEIDHITEYTAMQLLEKVGLTDERLREMLRSTYRAFVRKNMESILSKLDVAGVIKARVDAMKPKELEDLVLLVMKKELNAIVRLGAVIGFLLGLLNLIF